MTLFFLSINSFFRKTKQKKLFFLCFVFLISFCKYESSSQHGDILRVGIASDPSSLDPIYSVDLTSQKINSLLFSKLFRFKKDGNIEGDLVKDFYFKQNSLHMILNKLEMVDNSYLTSDDVIYSLNRLKEEKGPRRSRYLFIKSIHKISDFELEIEFDSMNRKYLDLLALAPSSIYKGTLHQENEIFRSSGLYYIKKWNKNETLELTRNRVSEKKLTEIHIPKELILQVLNQPSSAVYLFQKGSLDVMKIPYFLLRHPALINNEKKFVKGKSVQYLAVNHNNPCFDQKFRQALNLAIDRKLIISKIFESAASEINASVTDEYLQAFTDQRFYYSYDINLAKKLLSESSCYPEILTQTLEIRMRADDKNKAKGAAIAQYLKDLGLKVLVLPMEKTKLYKENGEKKGDLTLLTWYIDYDSIYNFIDPLFAKDSFGNGGNRSFYFNPKIEDYILKTRNNPEVKSNPVEIIKFLKEDSPWVFLWSIHENYILSKKASEFPELINLIIN